MTVTRVQHVTNTGSGSGSITANFSAATANNLLVAVVMTRANGSFAGMGTPSGWTLADQWSNNSNGNAPEISIFYKVAAGGETSVTCTDSVMTAGNLAIVVNEYSGLFTTSPLDVSAIRGDSATSTVTSLTSGTSGTLAQANELCIGAWAFRGVGTSATYSNSYTEDAFLAVNGDATTPGTLMVATREVSATTAQSSTATWTSPSGRAVGMLVTFKALAATNASATGASVGAAANGAQVSIKPPAGGVTVGTAAGSATTKVSPTSTVAAVGAAAQQPSISTLGSTADANGQTASVAAGAGTASASIAPHAEGTTVGAAAGSPSASIKPTATAATVTVASATMIASIYEPPTPISYLPSDDALLDLLVPQRREGYRFYLLDSGNNRIGRVYPQLGVRIENNTTQLPMRRMSGFKLSADDHDAVDLIGNRIAPVMVLENGSEYPLGVFMFADATDSEFSYGIETEATLVDQGLILGQTLRYPLGFDAGALVTDCMRQVAEAAGISSAYIDASSATLGSPLSWLAGGSDTYYSVMASLAAIAGFYAPYFDNDGRLIGRVAIDPTTSSPTITPYEAGTRIIAGTILRSNNLLSAPNVYMVVDTSSREAPIRAEYVLPDSAPHSIARRNFAITKVTPAPGVGNNDQAYELARQLAQTEVKAYETVNFQGATDPRHDTFDIVQFLGDTYIETGWSLTCLPGGPHEHELKRVYL